MTRKPSIPMTPSALPKQRSPEETVLPCRPEGFQGYCEWYDALPAELQTKRKPRVTEFLGAVEWVPCCGRAYHSACLGALLSPTCPTCRAPRGRAG